MTSTLSPLCGLSTVGQGGRCHRFSGRSRYSTRLVPKPHNRRNTMEVFESRLESFTKARRVKQTAKRTVSLKWPHPTHFVATPDTLTEAGFFFNPTWDARDSVECFFCGKCLDGWEEEDDPFTLHWDKCRDTCAWAVVRCGLRDDVDRKGKCVSSFYGCACHSLIIFLIALLLKILVDNQTESQWRKLGCPPSG